MRRSLIVAMATISVYCLTDAFASSPGERAGAPGQAVFTAEIVDAPIVKPPTDTVSGGMQAMGPAVSPEGISPAAESVAAAAKPPARPAAPTATPAPKTRVAAAPPRRPAPVVKAEPVAPAALATSTYTAPAWQPPMQPIAVAQRSTASAGCSGARWSQPDAAGVPVLLCN